MNQILEKEGLLIVSVCVRESVCCRGLGRAGEGGRKGGGGGGGGGGQLFLKANTDEV